MVYLICIDYICKHMQHKHALFLENSDAELAGLKNIQNFTLFLINYLCLKLVVG